MYLRTRDDTHNQSLIHGEIIAFRARSSKSKEDGGTGTFWGCPLPYPI
jgi:hypothetical protein